MPLELKLKCSNDEIHRIHVTVLLDPGKAWFHAETPDHDADYEMLMVSMGDEPSGCCNYARLIEGSISEIADSGEVGLIFILHLLEEVQKQGVESLEIHSEAFLNLIMDIVDHSIRNQIDGDPFDAVEILKAAQKYHEPLLKSSAFQSSKSSMAYLAFNHGRYLLLQQLCDMSDEPLVIVEVEKLEKESEYGMGHAVVKCSTKISIDDNTIDGWEFSWDGYVSSYDTMDWKTKKTGGYHTASWETEYALDASGQVEGLKEAEAAFEPEKPAHLNYKYVRDGDWAILHNEETWEYFETEEKAWEIFDSILNAHDYFKSYCGLYVTLVHRAPDPDRKGKEDYKYDPKDPTTWESLSFTEV